MRHTFTPSRYLPLSGLPIDASSILFLLGITAGTSHFTNTIATLSRTTSHITIYTHHLHTHTRHQWSATASPGLLLGSLRCGGCARVPPGPARTSPAPRNTSPFRTTRAFGPSPVRAAAAILRVMAERSGSARRGRPGIGADWRRRRLQARTTAAPIPPAGSSAGPPVCELTNPQASTGGGRAPTGRTMRGSRAGATPPRPPAPRWSTAAAGRPTAGRRGDVL